MRGGDLGGGRGEVLLFEMWFLILFAFLHDLLCSASICLRSARWVALLAFVYISV
jgi:hypothetical protein